jgi:hypothetical protein
MAPAAVVASRPHMMPALSCRDALGHRGETFGNAFGSELFVFKKQLARLEKDWRAADVRWLDKRGPRTATTTVVSAWLRGNCKEQGRVCSPKMIGL